MTTAITIVTEGEKRSGGDLTEGIEGGIIQVEEEAMIEDMMGEDVMVDTIVVVEVIIVVEVVVDTGVAGMGGGRYFSAVLNIIRNSVLVDGALFLS